MAGQQDQQKLSRKKQSRESTRRPSIVLGPRTPTCLTLTFGQLLDFHAKVRPDAPAVISHVQNRTITYKELCNRSINLAKAMAAGGIKKGDLVGIICGTRIEYLEIFFATARLGAALILFNYAYTDSEMLSLLKASSTCPLCGRMTVIDRNRTEDAVLSPRLCPL
jgi:mevalonyl-CoA ligase